MFVLRYKYPWPDFEIELVKNKGGDYEFMLFIMIFLKVVRFKLVITIF